MDQDIPAQVSITSPTSGDAPTLSTSEEDEKDDGPHHDAIESDDLLQEKEKRKEKRLIMRVTRTQRYQVVRARSIRN